MKKGTNLTSILQSVLAAAMGVQSAKNKERDFAKGRPAHFIIAGVLSTVMFIVFLVVIVKVVLGQMTA